MKLIDCFYAIFLCLTREDGNGDRHKRAAGFLETISTFILGFLTMLILGFFKLRVTNIVFWLLIMAGHALISYTLFNRLIILSDRYLIIIKKVNQYGQWKKIAYAIIAVIILFLSLGLLIGGGILSSYLLRDVKL
jgi:hypothetical protein